MSCNQSLINQVNRKQRIEDKAMSKKEKDRRTALLMQQSARCALCDDHMPTAHRMCFIKAQNALICRRCNQFRNAVMAGAKAGLTPQVLAAFHDRPPAPEPGDGNSPTKATLKKLTPEQLAGRQAVIEGRSTLTLEEWERRAGIRTAAEEPQCIYINGQLCDAQTGKPIE
jgi:hypothetical protein